MTEPVLLPERLDAATAAGVAQTLLGLVETDDLQLDARNTTHVGALGVQVLLSARQSALEADKGFALVNVQDRARDQLCLMGLSDLMMPEGEE